MNASIPPNPRIERQPMAINSSRVFMRYLVSGLLIGGFWYLNRNTLLWEEALRTIAVFTGLLVFLRTRMKSRSIELHFIPLLAAKVILIAIAATIQSFLVPTVADASLYVAIGLGLAVAVLGPFGDHRFFTRNPVRTRGAS